MTIKQLSSQIHLWAGLTIGVLFFAIALSGAIYTWEPELSRILYKQKVEAQDHPFVSVSTLKTTLGREFPQGDFRTVLFRDKKTAAQVLLYGQGTYYHAYLNPYSGKLLHIQDMNTGILYFIKALHRNLLMGNFGRQLVHWVTFLSFFMLLTGLVLWWPVHKKGRKQRLTIKWRAAPTKLNYDLHNVLGFYATWILIFIVSTGLFWGFDLVKDSLRLLSGENRMVYEKPVSVLPDSILAVNQFSIMDSLAATFVHQFPQKMVRVSNPHQGREAIRVVLIEPSRTVYNTSHYFFDRYTGRRLAGQFEQGLAEDISPYTALNGLVYDIHLGNILGLPGRLLVCFASLIAASLPITGFLIWWGRRKNAVTE